MTRVSESKIQRNHYAETASRYDGRHVVEHDEHHVSLSYVSALIRRFNLRTVLDIGCGTGRTQTYLARSNPEVAAYGIEPVPELLAVTARKGIDKRFLVNGSGLDLPFRSGSVDAVVECGVLHHVREPERVVNEMMRVARRAVFLSDSNIFGQGRFGVRLLKRFLYGMGLWRYVKFLQTRGRGYTVSDGDGLFYSYSVYFQYDALQRWADRVVTIPAGGGRAASSFKSPVLIAPTVLLCAIKERGL
jgi:SAM-dependent methyltransferase